ncbi:MAG: phage antirepressor KilAC domain-containing protein [Oscillospiraceae bacterium]|nr:phage antirepressor KilAC domain-containing protein [Oscillospiraceae bacterium]
MTDVVNEKKEARTQVSVFESEEFGSVRTVREGDKVLFCGSDVAKALGYTNARKALSDHCRYVTKRYAPHPQSQNKTIEMSFISEGDVYRLIAHSKLPAAEKFESWVFDEVLPTIRQTGGYVDSGREAEFIKFYFPSFSEDTKLTMVLDLKGQNAKLRDTLETQKPKVEFADAVLASDDSISMGTMSKLLCKKGTKIGRTRLFKLLRDNKVLMDNNEPYQAYVENGWFEVVEKTYLLPSGKVNIWRTTKVKPRGQVGISKLVKKVIA